MDTASLPNNSAGKDLTIGGQIASERKPSRRDLLKTGASIAAAGSAIPLVASDAAAQGQDADAGTLDRLLRAIRDRRRRILLKGATIISMDPAVGDFVRADLLIEGKTIASVGPDLSSAAQDGNAIVVDANRTVLIPGMVDCHRHAWEGQIRGVIPNSATIGDYMGATHRGFAPFYRPDDMYVGNLITALGCIDAGITCFIDNSHNSRSPAHSDAAVQALLDSGARAVHASGAPTFAEWDRQWPQDVSRLQRQFFASDDQLVTLRLFSRGRSRRIGRRHAAWNFGCPSMAPGRPTQHRRCGNFSRRGCSTNVTPSITATACPTRAGSSFAAPAYR